MKHFIKKVFKRIFEHKIISGLAFVAVLAGIYFTYNSLNSTSSEPHYVLAKAQTGTIIVSVTGTGQISAQNQVDIKSKVSGDVISVNATSGMAIKSGDLILRLDDTDALKSVRDAQANLQSAQLALAKLQQPADQLSLIQAQNALTQAQQSKQTAQDNLVAAYQDGFNTVSNAFLNLPNVMNGLSDTFFKQL